MVVCYDDVKAFVVGVKTLKSTEENLQHRYGQPEPDSILLEDGA
jgi:hypothetical protein